MQKITDSERKLLVLLLANSRSSISSLGVSMDKSRNWISRKIKKLVQNNILRSYVTILNPAYVYAERSSLLLVKTNPRETDVSQALLAMSELEWLDGLSGENSLIGLFRFRDAHAFENFLDVVDKVTAKSLMQTYNLVQVLTTYKMHGFPVPITDLKTPSISKNDWELLSILRRREATTEHPFPPTQQDIGDMMENQLSQPAISKSLRKLKKHSSILGFSIDIDFSYIGLPIKFFLRIRSRPGKVAQVAQSICGFDEIWDLQRVGDEFSLFATVRIPSVRDYNIFLRKLYQNPDILDTQSQISLEEWYIPAKS
ncbi:MAG: hypothetical protein BAJATHORv1_110018 [Candidatus Thorarchaeota archaeon]|nr:MAG: hypothetical protein BAJATHORv1_110018 [Candidatus Thorarchaeota archaeon]